MKTELMNITGKGICIVISDINPNDFVFGGDKPLYGGGRFRDVVAIANEIRAGRKIAAIKECRAQTGWGLREAKNYIDKYTGQAYNSSDELKSVYADRFIEDHMLIDAFDPDEFKI